MFDECPEYLNQASDPRAATGNCPGISLSFLDGSTQPKIARMLMFLSAPLCLWADAPKKSEAPFHLKNAVQYRTAVYSEGHLSCWFAVDALRASSNNKKNKKILKNPSETKIHAKSNIFFANPAACEWTKEMFGCSHSWRSDQEWKFHCCLSFLMLAS